MQGAGRAAVSLTAEITDSTLRDVCLKRAARWHNRSVRETILKDASGVYSLRTADFDRDPYLLNCQNGTLNLRTDEFREHRAEDFLSLTSGVSTMRTPVARDGSDSWRKSCAARMKPLRWKK